MKNILFFCFAILTIFSCSTIKFQYDSINNDKKSTFIIKTDKNLNLTGELRSSLIKPGIFKGIVKIDETGDTYFYIDEFSYFTNWAEGWTKGINSASGSIKFSKDSNSYKCSIIDEVKIWDLKFGESRYLDSFYKNDSGLNNLKNKFERIKSVNDFLKKSGFPEYFSFATKSTKFIKSYKDTIKGYLFPELYNYSILYSKEATDDYKIKDLSNDTVLKESILWNKRYTLKVFPEHLREIRDTGTLFRDYEETLELFFMDYNFTYYIENVLCNSEFNLKIIRNDK